MSAFVTIEVKTVAERRQILKGLVGAGLCALVVACAQTSPTVQPDADAATPSAVKDEVEARASARWQALLKGDLETAYQYLSPASKAVMPLDVYKGKHKIGMYRAAKVESVACEADVCTVMMSVTYDHKKRKGIVTPLTEKWVISGGRAWYVERA